MFYAAHVLLLTVVAVVTWWGFVIAAALIPGFAISWLVFRFGGGLWVSVFCAECLVVLLILLKHYLVAPILFISDLHSYLLLLSREALWMFFLANVVAMPPVFFVVRLGYVAARRATANRGKRMVKV